MPFSGFRELGLLRLRNEYMRSKAIHKSFLLGLKGEYRSKQSAQNITFSARWQASRVHTLSILHHGFIFFNFRYYLLEI